MKKRLSSQMRKYHFSIVELVLVCATIIVLASMFVAPLRRAKILALQTLCANNLRQIGIAAQMYKKNYKELPYTTYFLNDFTPFYPYLRSLEVFVCPGNPYSVKKVNSQADLFGKTDYIFFPGMFIIEDNEKNGKKNNGHGNNINPYGIKLDPSNKNFNEKFQRMFAEKITFPAIYDRCGPAHFKSINIANLENDSIRLETRPDMCNLWTLNPDGTLCTDTAILFPPLPADN